MHVEVRDSRVEEEGHGGKTYRCRICAIEDGEVVAERHYNRKLDNFSISQEYLQELIDDQKDKMRREVGNVQRIDPGAIS